MDNPQSAESIDPKQFLRFAPLALGLLMVLAATGMQTWKESSRASAQGAVKKYQHDLTVLKHDRSEAEKEEAKEKFTKKIEALEKKENGIMLKASAKSAAASSGIWLLSMIRWVGISLVAVGFLALAVLGSNYEKTGALIGLGFLAARLL